MMHRPNMRGGNKSVALLCVSLTSLPLFLVWERLLLLDTLSERNSPESLLPAGDGAAAQEDKLVSDLPTAAAAAAAATRPIPSSRYHHTHAIPDILTFTHRVNLLARETVLYFVDTPRFKLTEKQKELLALQQNVRNTVSFNSTQHPKFAF